MQATDRQLLQSSIEPLARAISNYEDIKELLIISDTFNRVMIDHIERATTDSFTKNLLLISDLQTRGPNAFRTFVEILESIGCIEALRIISPQSLSNQSSDRINNNNSRKSHSTRQATSYPLGLFSYNFSADDNFHQQHHLQRQDIKIACEEISHFSKQNQNGDNRHGTDEINCVDNNGQQQQNSFPQQTLHQQQQQPQPPSQQQKSLLHWHPYPSPSTPMVPHNVNTASTLRRDEIDKVKNNKTTTNTTTSNMTIGASRAPKAMTVKNSVVCHNDHIEDYKMTSKPRGLCLIINNIKFDGDILAERKGSDIDASRFATIFKQLWFEVYHELNLTASDMIDTIDRFSSKCTMDHDALIVIILSHGSDRGLYGSDGLEIDPADVFGRFDNERCKPMKGKPKVFILQACRGTLADYGEQCEDSPDEEDNDMMNCIGNRPPLFTRSIEFSNTRGACATQTDMMICYSCLPGYVSVRNEIAGSWLGTALGYYLMTCAWEKDLEEILAMVSKDFEGRVSSHGHKQALEIKYLGWRKRLFFNPGIYQ